MKRVWLCMAFLFASLAAFAQPTAFQNHCYLGGTPARTSGMNSTNYLNGIIPSCTVTVYLTGTQNKATIYRDAASDPLANPFTANALGSVDPGGWIFWAATGQGYDVVLSGGIAPLVYLTPVTLRDLIVPASGGGGSQNCLPPGTPGTLLYVTGTCALALPMAETTATSVSLQESPVVEGVNATAGPVTLTLPLVSTLAANGETYLIIDIGPPNVAITINTSGSDMMVGFTPSNAPQSSIVLCGLYDFILITGEHSATQGTNFWLMSTWFQTGCID